MIGRSEPDYNPSLSQHSFLLEDAKRRAREQWGSKSINSLAAKLGPIGHLVPEALFQWLACNFGWNLLITATK